MTEPVSEPVESAAGEPGAAQSVEGPQDSVPEPPAGIDPLTAATGDEIGGSRSERFDSLSADPVTSTGAPAAEGRREIRGGPVWPLLLGGIMAVAVGAGAAGLAQRTGYLDLGSGRVDAVRADVDAQSVRLQGLQAAVDAASAEIAALRDVKPDLSAVNNATRDLASNTRARLDALSKRLDEVEARLAGVETQPIPKAELPAEVVAAYEARLADIEAAVDERFLAMQQNQDARLDGKLEEISATQAAARSEGEIARNAARAAQARAALADIGIALDNGGPFAEALAALKSASGIEAPPALAKVSDGGAPTLAELRTAFPDAARVALVAATRAAASDGSVGSWTVFLRTQLGARSLEPRQGADPDAVLSRAEAALARGDLDAVTAEIDTLPEPGKAAFSDWLKQMGNRRDALAALRDLSISTADK